MAQQLKPLFDTYAKSVYDKNVDAFMALFDENVRLFDMWGPWITQGIQPWRASVTEWFGGLKNERVKVEFADIQEVATPEMAVASAVVTFTAVDMEDKKIRSMQNRLSWTAQKKNGVWKVVHEHTSSPIDHATLKAQLTR